MCTSMKWVLAVIAAGGCANAARAAVIYQDNFANPSLSAIPLNGTTPSPTDTGAATWTADSSYTIPAGGGFANFGSNSRSAYLPFTPSSGYTYDLRVTITGTGVDPGQANNGRLNFGYFDSSTTTGVDGAIVGSSASILYYPGGFTPSYAYLPSVGVVSQDTTSEGNGTYTYDLILNTVAPHWTLESKVNGHDFTNTPVYTYTANPTSLGEVGVSDYDTATGTFTSFTLTATPVPEPAALAVLAIGMPLLLRRRKLS